MSATSGSSPAGRPRGDWTPKVRSTRRAGILLHLTSLPGRFGIGDLGPEADRFIDFLAAAGQSVWQVMPLGPPGFGNSPYAARSGFAGSPLLLSPDLLMAAGLLEGGDLEPAPAFASERVDFGSAIAWKEELLERAYERFRAAGRLTELEPFEADNASWLSDYALYMALADDDPRSWVEWQPPLVRREPGALDAARRRLGERISFHVFLQSLFAEQWKRFKVRAAAAGVQILGDIPIFPTHDSADVWANQDIFKLDPDGRSVAVAGVPPDNFSATGQLWGNPLYRWDVLAARDYTWWVERFRRAFELVDLVRVDHFRGFEAGWEVPATDETAERGRWVKGPGLDLFVRVAAELGDQPIVAEDLGHITAEVEKLRDACGFPGMKVLQFAFDDDASNAYLPHNYASSNCVVYTGTHDNDTTAGWFAARGEEERERVWRYLGGARSQPGVDGGDMARALIRLAYQSVAELAITPMQDVLGLGGAARMNRPGEAEGNWGWRFDWRDLEEGRAGWLRDLALTYGRLPPAP